MAGFRYLLLLEDGEAADPAAFNTAVPVWREGDEFLAGSELQRFRIRAISPTPEASPAREKFDAIWTVEPLERRSIDTVTVATGREGIVIPWASRQELLQRVREH